MLDAEADSIVEPNDFDSVRASGDDDQWVLRSVRASGDDDQWVLRAGVSMRW
jgi:hypothetical protein